MNTFCKLHGNSTITHYILCVRKLPLYRKDHWLAPSFFSAKIFISTMVLFSTKIFHVLDRYLHYLLTMISRIGLKKLLGFYFLFILPPSRRYGSRCSSRALFTSWIFFAKCHYSTFVCIWQLLSNHRLIRFKGFVLLITCELCN
jgi:hypothetical protein